MFELNQNIQIEEYKVQNSSIFVIDNFYKNPDKILNLFLSTPTIVHKKNEQKSYNMIFFEDKRHIFKCEELIYIHKFLSNICNQKTFYYDNLGFTNWTRFKKLSFNDYVNNYWWPHLDGGYNGVVYLNKNDQVSGTNLYEQIYFDEFSKNAEEHYKPWVEKNKYKLIYQIKPKYNRMVLFDGGKFVHGMNICNDDYFSSTYRINQVFFFEENKDHEQIAPPKNLKETKIKY